MRKSVFFLQILFFHSSLFLPFDSEIGLLYQFGTMVRRMQNLTSIFAKKI